MMPDRIKKAKGPDAKYLAFVEATDERYRKFTSKVLVAVAIIGVTSAIALALGGQGILNNSDRINDVQGSRLAACNDTNDRNAKSVDKLNGIYAEAIKKAGPARRKELELSLQQTIGLINALVPARNCKAIVESTGK